MSKSKKQNHFMDDNFRLYKSIRKKMPPATKVHNSKQGKRNKKWDWREELEEISEGEDNEC